MTYGVSSVGFTPKPQSVISSEMKTAIRGRISATLNLGSRSLLGQAIDVCADQIAQVWQGMQDVYTSRDRAQAVGVSLDIIGSLIGVPRIGARASVAYMTITLDAGTYAAGSLRVNVVGDPSRVFSNRSDITVGSTTTLTNQVFDCTVTGPTSAPAGTLTEIPSPVTGFSAPTNPEDASLGALRENDTTYRNRQILALARKGSTSTNAIRSALLDASLGTTYASVLENDTDSTDGNGLPPHSIEAVVLGGSDADIATTIFLKKAAGIQTNGGVDVNVTDSSGGTRHIYFSRPTDVAVKFGVTFSYLRSYYPSASDAQTAVKNSILAMFSQVQAVGADVVLGVYYAALFNTPGVVGGTLQVAKVADSLGSSDVVIAAREMATLLLANISATGTAVAARP